MSTSWFTSWKPVYDYQLIYQLEPVDEYQLIYQLKTSRWLPVDLPVENQYDYQLIYQLKTSRWLPVDLPVENQYEYQLVYQLKNQFNVSYAYSWLIRIFSQKI